MFRVAAVASRDANLPDRADRFELALGLPTRPDHANARRVCARKIFSRDAARRAGPLLTQAVGLHDGEQIAVVRVDQVKPETRFSAEGGIVLETGIAARRQPSRHHLQDAIRHADALARTVARARLPHLA